MMTGRAIPAMATATTRTTLEAATAGIPAAKPEPAAADRIPPPIPAPPTTIMSWARDACQSLECELATAEYDILLGMGFALIDNIILQLATFIWELGSGWDSYDSNKFRQDMEDWVIENGVTDTTYFYLGQIISDALQAYFAVKQIPKLVKKIGPMLTKLSSILAGASGGGGMQLAFAGVEGYAASIGISGTAVGSLIDPIGVVGAGVVVVFADVTGIGHDAGKFMESIQDASMGTGNFGNLSRAGEYGIKPYDKMKKALEGTGLQAHHVIEQRFGFCHCCRATSIYKRMAKCVQIWH